MSITPSASSAAASAPFGINVLDDADLSQASLVVPTPTYSTPTAKPAYVPPRTPVDRARRPIDDYIDQIAQTIEQNQFTIVCAETGAGKSLGVPQMLANLGKHVVVTEPRIIAAKSLAARASDEMGENLGERVGYRTALYHKDSPDTQLLYCTDGLEMVRRLAGRERQCDVLVIDEIHEWNTNMEVLLAWVKSQAKENPQMRVVIMSATIDSDGLKDYLGAGTATVEVPGRTFKVTQVDPGRSIEDDVKKLVDSGRNVLVFQPGKREIEETIEALRKMRVNAEILPCHGDMPLEEQDRVFKRYARPKVVVATNVAQTSITISDIDAVVDSGTERRIETENEIEGLYIGPVSQADSAQRRGRAGRTKPGIYIDHCETPWAKRPDFPVPEMRRVRPDQAILRLLEAGVDIEEFQLFHSPSAQAIAEAKKTLRALGCVDKDDQITPLGREIARLPTSVEGGRMIVEAKRRGVLDEVVTAVAIREAGTLVDFENDNWRNLCYGEDDADLLALAKVLEAMEQELAKANDSGTSTKEIFEYYGVKEKVFHRAVEARSLIRQHLGFETEERPPSNHNHIDIVKSLAAGLVEHVYQQTDAERGLYRNGAEPRKLSRSSVVHGSDWLVGKPFDVESKKDDSSKIHHLITYATRIKPAWIAELAPHLMTVQEGENPRYSQKNDQVIFARKSYCGRRELDTEYYADPSNPKAPQVFAEWLADTLLDKRAPKKVQKLTELKEVWEHNCKYTEDARRANRKAKAEVMPEYDRAKLAQYYIEKLAGKSSLAEIEDLSILRLP